MAKTVLMLLVVFSRRLAMDPAESITSWLVRVLKVSWTVCALVMLLSGAEAVRVPTQVIVLGGRLVLCSERCTVVVVLVLLLGGVATRQVLLDTLRLVSLVQTCVLWVWVRLHLLSISELVLLVSMKLLWLPLYGWSILVGLCLDRDSVCVVTKFVIEAGMAVVLVLLVITMLVLLHRTTCTVSLTPRVLAAYVDIVEKPGLCTLATTVSRFGSTPTTASGTQKGEMCCGLDLSSAV